jgi:hypothetical protein
VWGADIEGFAEGGGMREEAFETVSTLHAPSTNASKDESLTPVAA